MEYDDILQEAKNCEIYRKMLLRDPVIRNRLRNMEPEKEQCILARFLLNLFSFDTKIGNYTIVDQIAKYLESPHPENLVLPKLNPTHFMITRNRYGYHMLQINKVEGHRGSNYLSLYNIVSIIPIPREFANDYIATYECFKLHVFVQDKPKGIFKNADPFKLMLSVATFGIFYMLM